MKKKKYINNLLVPVLIVIISVITSFILTNFNTLRIPKEERKLIAIREDEFEVEGFSKENGKYISTDNLEHIIQFNLKPNVYINKIIIKYSLDYDIDWKMSYNGQNVYGNYKSIETSGRISNKINKFVEKISNRTTDLKITFSKGNFEFESIEIDNRLKFNANASCVFSILSLTIYFLILYRSKLFKNIEKLFLLLAMSITISMFIMLPMMLGNSWDDQIHYNNSKNLFAFNEIEKSEASNAYIDVPKNTCFSEFNTIEEQREYYRYLNNSNETYQATGTRKKVVMYNELAYIPFAVPLKLGNMIGIPFVLNAVISRMINCILYITIVYFAIKKIPIYKKLMLVVSLIPTSIFLSTQFSYDPFVIAFLMLGFSYFLYEYKEKNKIISVKSTVIIYGSFCLACFTKAIYAPLLLITLLLPREKFSSDSIKKKYKIFTIIIFLLLMSTFVLPVIFTNREGDIRGGIGVHATQQFKLILRSPLSYINIFWKNAIIRFFYELLSPSTLFYFAYFGVISLNPYYLYLFLILFLVFSNNENKEWIDNKYRIFLAILYLIVYSLIWTAFYLSFTPVGLTVINGVQNRYFLPILFPILTGIFNFKNKNNINENKQLIILSAIVLLGSYYFLINTVIRNFI